MIHFSQFWIPLIKKEGQGVVLNWRGGWVSKWCAFWKEAVIRPINEACTNDVDAAYSTFSCPGYSRGQGENSTLSFYTTIFYNRADFPSYFRVFQMKVSEGNQNSGDKFNNSRIYLIFIWNSGSHSLARTKFKALPLHHVVLTQTITHLFISIT